MALHRFIGLVATVYPFDRDATGQPLGEVQPGDVRDLDRPLDWQWVPAGDGDSQAGTGVEHPADGTLSPPVGNDPQDGQQPGEQVIQAPEPAAPVPAPPAAPPAGPQPFAVTTGP